jgi:DNA-binding GntR family transcriptional regulator
MVQKSAAKLTQTERAYAAIKRAILQGQIVEGGFLEESEIMSKCGIGRTRYREACNRLIHEGLLEAIPRAGFIKPSRMGTISASEVVAQDFAGAAAQFIGVIGPDAFTPVTEAARLRDQQIKKRIAVSRIR